MDLIAAAWKDLQDRISLVYAYVGLHGLLVLIAGLVEYPLAQQIGDGPVPAWAAGFTLTKQCVLAACGAAVQAIVLSRIGKEIDKPLWKCASDGEALRRFWLVWFLLGLGFTVLSELRTLAIANDITSLAGMLEVVAIFYQFLVVPIGACVMYWGRLEWSDLGETLRPIARQFSLVIFVFMLQFAQFFVSMVLAQTLVSYPPDEIDRVFVLALGILPLNLLEVLAFVVMWRVLMINRDTPEANDDDFDF